MQLFDDPNDMGPLLPRDAVSDGILGKSHDLRTEVLGLAKTG